MDGDFILIYDYDLLGHSHLISRLSGPDLGPKSWPSMGSNWETKKISSSNNKMLVEFRSDEEYVYKGFSATIQFTELHNSKKCDSWLDMKKKTLLSPNYPQTYDKNISCTWLITVRHGLHITLDLIEFDVSSLF